MPHPPLWLRLCNRLRLSWAYVELHPGGAEDTVGVIFYILQFAIQTEVAPFHSEVCTLAPLDRADA